MKINIHVKSEFECVYLANGLFLEYVDNIEYEDNIPLYITVYPLNAIYLPYTIKIVGGNVTNNEQLAVTYNLADKHYLIKLKPRCNYVYSPSKEVQILPCDNIAKFFMHIKKCELSYARNYLTPSLSSSITDENLLLFFEDYIDIIDNNYVDTFSHTYFLIDKSYNGSLFSFSLTNNLIDNMEEVNNIN